MQCNAGVRGGGGRGPRHAQAAVGDRAGRLQRRAAGRDRPLASLHLAAGGLACPAARRSILLVPSGGSKV